MRWCPETTASINALRPNLAVWSSSAPLRDEPLHGVGVSGVRGTHQRGLTEAVERVDVVAGLHQPGELARVAPGGRILPIVPGRQRPQSFDDRPDARRPWRPRGRFRSRRSA